MMDNPMLTGSKIINQATATPSNNHLAIFITGLVFSILILFYIFINRNKIKIWIMLHLKRARYLRGIFVYPNKQLREVHILVNDVQNNMFIYDKGEYRIYPERLIFKKTVPLGVWYLNNSEQVDLFNPTNKGVISPDTLKVIMRNKLVKEMVRPEGAGENTIKLMMIIIIVNLIVTIIGIMMMFRR